VKSSARANFHPAGAVVGIGTPDGSAGAAAAAVASLLAEARPPRATAATATSAAHRRFEEKP
jgi:hypothetical protein